MARKSGVSFTRAISAASSSSAESCIHVGGPRLTRSASTSSAVSHASTPPTSLPEESVSEQATHEHVTAQPSTRRDLRRKSGPATYNLKATSSATSTANDTRDFSGATLVDVASASTTNTPQRKLLDDSVKALDLDWEIDSMPAELPHTVPLSKPQRRNSVHVHRLVKRAASAVDKVKSVLGKRDRAPEETGKDASRRQSRRLVALEQEKTQVSQSSSEAVETEETVERPSKLARLSSMFSLTSAASAPAIPKPTVCERSVKRYQRQGLYVGQDNGSSDKTDKPKKRKSTASTTSLKQEAMPLPMWGYAEKERSFMLPFDVFAPAYRARGDEKPKDWGKIGKNRLVGDAKAIWRNTRLERSVCACVTPASGSLEPGCSDCLNRHMHYECDDDNCNLGDECSNRDFAGLAARTERASKCDKKGLAHVYHAGVEVIRTSDRGFGVRAVRSFSPGEIITEYIGEIITPEEAERRIREEYKGKGDYYQMEFDQGMILDATKGSVARFVNHSCEPNCKMEKRFVAGQPRMALFAGDGGVLTGQELTYDYNFDNYNAFNVQQCRCGAVNCRGVLGPRPKDAKKPATKLEKDNAAASLKRKAPEVLDTPSDADLLRSLLTKKRKVRQFSKGWVYVDSNMEAARQEEAALDKEIARLKREGVFDQVTTEIPKKQTTSKAKAKEVVEKLEEKIKSKMSKTKEKMVHQDDEPKESRRSSIYSRLSGSVKDGEKRKSIASLRQSTLSFHRLSNADMTEEQEMLLERPATSSSIGRTLSNAKNSLIGRKTSNRIKATARNSTLVSG